MTGGTYIAYMNCKNAISGLGIKPMCDIADPVIQEYYTMKLEDKEHASHIV